MPLGVGFAPLIFTAESGQKRLACTGSNEKRAPFAPLALGARQRPHGDKDQTGSGSGWNLTITSTTFSTGGGSPQTLSNTASEVKGVTSACARGTCCTNPTNSVSYPLTLPAGSAIPATPVKLFNAAVGTGLGDFTVTPTVGVTIPANAYAGTYTSTITLAVASAP
jgi:hypothetical protein